MRNELQAVHEYEADNGVVTVAQMCVTINYC